MPSFYYVLGQRVDVIDSVRAVEKVIGWARDGQQRYVCLSNVHMIMEGYDDDAFRDVINRADLVAPDGMPLVWALRVVGAKEATRVRGPDLMPRLLAEAERTSVEVGFLGSTEHTLNLLLTVIRARFPRLRVAFSYSPPFRKLSGDEDQAVVARINASGVKLLFVGLGCPKQEWWMAEHCHRVRAVLVGTGAAFDFLAGTKREAPEWMQILGLEWLHRLLTEPRRLWWRYLRHNPRFLFHWGLELLER